jgi:ParB-like chromosome segregation protein Spo0J
MPKPTIQFRKVDDLVPDPRNARTHSDAQVEEIATSIRRFGWTAPALADELIRAGHGRQRAAQLIYAAGERIYMAPGKERGGHMIPDGTMPVIDCTGWTEEERRAYALADNRIAENAGWDIGILTGELDALAGVDFDMAPLGFGADAIEQLIGTPEEGEAPAKARGQGTDADSTYEHVDQFAVIVRCADEAAQEACFNALRQTYGADNVKVVVV